MTPPRLSSRTTSTLLEGNPFLPRWHNGALCESLGRHLGEEGSPYRRVGVAL